MAENTGNDLEVRIGATDDGLKDGLNDAKKSIKGFEKTATNSAKAVNSVNRSNTNLGKSFSSVGKKTANATPAVQEFSRVIQDAPYGIQGVANNIQQLTAQFGYLKQSTGSTKSALKAMIGAMTGPAGVLLAVSVITSAMVQYGDAFIDTSSDADKLKKKQEDLIKSTQDFKDSLDATTKATLKGEQAAAKEVSTLRLLRSQAENTALSQDKRTEAAKELQRLYPSYFASLSNEQILLGNVSGAYDTLSTAILKKAKAQAASSLIAEKEKKILLLKLQLDKKSLEYSEAKGKSDKENAKSVGTSLESSLAAVGRQAKLEDKANELLEAKTGILKEITKLQEDSLKLAEDVEANGGIVPLDFKVKPNTENFKGELVENIKTSINEIDESVFGDTTILLPSLLDQDKMTEDEAAYAAHLERMRISLENFDMAAKHIVGDGITNTFASMADAIGVAFANGENAAQAGGAALLAGLGGILQQYGKLVLATGLASQAFKEAMLNPFGGGVLAIAAGAALIAIGGAVKANASKMSSSSSSSSSASGSGSYTAPTSSGSSYSSGSNSSNSLQNVVFEIAGTKLVGVLSNTLDRNKSLNGTIAIS